MIKVYYLPVEKIDNTEVVAGGTLIYNAILDCTDSPTLRKLIMDTTDEEHQALSALASEVRDPTLEEIAAFEALPPQPPPDPDEIRLQEIVAHSPDAITMPDIWEAIRILAKLRGTSWET